MEKQFNMERAHCDTLTAADINYVTGFWFVPRIRSSCSFPSWENMFSHCDLFAQKPLASFSTLIPKRLGHCQWLQWYQLCNRFLPRIANVLETWHRKWQHICSCSSCTKTAKHWITFTQDKFYSVGETCNTQSTWSKKCSNSVIQSILFSNLIKSYIKYIETPCEALPTRLRDG